MQETFLRPVDIILNGLSKLRASRIGQSTENLLRHYVQFDRWKIFHERRKRADSLLEIRLVRSNVDVQFLIKVRELVFRQYVVAEKSGEDTQSVRRDADSFCDFGDHVFLRVKRALERSITIFV